MTLSCPLRWVEEHLGDGNNTRNEKWTGSIAVGSKRFVGDEKSVLEAFAKGRKPREGGEGYQLREPSAAYGDHFGVKNGDIGVDNAYFLR